MKHKSLPKNESDTVEFKVLFTEDLIVSLVAFANTKGGSVYLGVTDNGKIIGIIIIGIIIIGMAKQEISRKLYQFVYFAKLNTSKLKSFQQK